MSGENNAVNAARKIVNIDQEGEIWNLLWNWTIFFQSFNQINTFLIVWILATGNWRKMG